MTFRSYLVFMCISTVLAWAAWGFVVVNFNPNEAGALGFFLFYVTLALGLVGGLALSSLVIRVYALGRKDFLSREVKVSFRHAVLLSSVAILSIILSHNGMLHWWILLLLIVLISLVEYLSLVVQQSRRG